MDSNITTNSDSGASSPLCAKKDVARIDDTEPTKSDVPHLPVTVDSGILGSAMFLPRPTLQQKKADFAKWRTATGCIYGTPGSAKLNLELLPRPTLRQKQADIAEWRAAVAVRHGTPESANSDLPCQARSQQVEADSVKWKGSAAVGRGYLPTPADSERGEEPAETEVSASAKSVETSRLVFSEEEKRYVVTQGSVWCHHDQWELFEKKYQALSIRWEQEERQESMPEEMPKTIQKVSGLRGPPEDKPKKLALNVNSTNLTPKDMKAIISGAAVALGGKRSGYDSAVTSPVLRTVSRHFPSYCYQQKAIHPIDHQDRAEATKPLSGSTRVEFSKQWSQLSSIPLAEHCDLQWKSAYSVWLEEVAVDWKWSHLAQHVELPSPEMLIQLAKNFDVEGESSPLMTIWNILGDSEYFQGLEVFKYLEAKHFRRCYARQGVKGAQTSFVPLQHSHSGSAACSGAVI